MVASRLTHDLVCIGAHAPREHDFPAANARAVHDLFTGGLGPPRLVADVRTGPRVTCAAVASAMEAASERAATNYVFYFSGHATPAGFAVLDGTISAEMMARHVSHLRARAVLLVLDVVIGARPDHALLPPWLRELAEDRPGLRVIAARATRIGAGVAGGGLSRFTSAFVTALEEAPGDMRIARSPFISDKRALTEARRVLGERWGVTHLPLDLGTFGDMPLTRSQKAAPIGEAAVEAVVPGSGFSAAITWRLEGRANMPTTLYYALEDAASRVVAEGTTTVMAQDPLQKGKERVRFSPKVVKRGGHSTQQRAGALKWRVSLMDPRGRVLAERVVDHS